MPNGNGNGGALERAANSAWLLVMGRVAAILAAAVVSFGVWQIQSFLEEQAALAREVSAIKTEFVRLNTSLEEGHKPRLAGLEADVRALEEDVARRTVDRFTASDAAALETRIHRSLERGLEGLAKDIRALAARFDRRTSLPGPH